MLYTICQNGMPKQQSQKYLTNVSKTVIFGHLNFFLRRRTSANLKKCELWARRKTSVTRIITRNQVSFHHLLFWSPRNNIITIFRTYILYGRKIIHSTRCLFTFTCQLSGHSKFFSPYFSKFEVEWDWISKVSQKRTANRLDFKIDGGGKFAVECVSNDNIFSKCLFSIFIVKFLEKKIGKYFTLEKLENLSKRNNFSKKKRFHHFKKHLLCQW